MNEIYEPVSHDDEWVNDQLNDSAELRAEYEARNDEYSLLDTLIRARTDAGLSQKGVADRIGKHQSSIARLESTLISSNGSVSLAFLREYARACGKEIQINFIDV